ncbi:unnamed protein product [Closterium sp. NIES-65]|nr:unnamed protein product [Closterium sp. NIES-65]
MESSISLKDAPEMDYKEAFLDVMLVPGGTLEAVQELYDICHVEAFVAAMLDIRATAVARRRLLGVVGPGTTKAEQYTVRDIPVPSSPLLRRPTILSPSHSPPPPHTQDAIPTAMLRISGVLHEPATRLFNDVLRFMGVHEGKMLSRAEEVALVARVFLDLGKEPPLRDELFLQLWKQTRGNEYKKAALDSVQEFASGAGNALEVARVFLDLGLRDELLVQLWKQTRWNGTPAVRPLSDYFSSLVSDEAVVACRELEVTLGKGFQHHLNPRHPLPLPSPLFPSFPPRASCLKVWELMRLCAGVFPPTPPPPSRGLSLSAPLRSSPTRRASCLKVWELMRLCAGVFPPTTTVAGPLSEYFSSLVSDEAGDEAIREAVLAAWKALDHGLKHGPRRCVPGQDEVLSLLTHTPLSVPVYLCDDTLENIPSSAVTTIGEAMQTTYPEAYVTDVMAEYVKAARCCLVAACTLLHSHMISHPVPPHPPDQVPLDPEAACEGGTRQPGGMQAAARHSLTLSHPVPPITPHHPPHHVPLDPEAYVSDVMAEYVKVARGSLVACTLLHSHHALVLSHAILPTYPSDHVPLDPEAYVFVMAEYVKVARGSLVACKLPHSHQPSPSPTPFISSPTHQTMCHHVPLDPEAYVSDVMAEYVKAARGSLVACKLLLKKRFFKTDDALVADLQHVRLCYAQVGVEVGFWVRTGTWVDLVACKLLLKKLFFKTDDALVADLQHVRLCYAQVGCALVACKLLLKKRFFKTDDALVADLQHVRLCYAQLRYDYLTNHYLVTVEGAVVLAAQRVVPVCLFPPSSPLTTPTLPTLPLPHSQQLRYDYFTNPYLVTVEGAVVLAVAALNGAACLPPHHPNPITPSILTSLTAPWSLDHEATRRDFIRILLEITQGSSKYTQILSPHARASQACAWSLDHEATMREFVRILLEIPQGGSVFFDLRTEEDTANYFPKHVIVGVNHNGLHFLDAEIRSVIHQAELRELAEYAGQPDRIFFSMTLQDELHSFEFATTGGDEICFLLDIHIANALRASQVRCAGNGQLASSQQIPPSCASLAKVYVASTGSDTGCCDSTTAPCASLQAAVARAAPSATITLLPLPAGSPLSAIKSSPTKSAVQLGGKSLTITGAPPASTPASPAAITLDCGGGPCLNATCAGAGCGAGSKVVLTLALFTLTNGVSADSGGCVDVRGQGLVINNVAFSRCSATNLGGAVSVQGAGASLTVSSASFSACSAPGSDLTYMYNSGGGAISVTGPEGGAAAPGGVRAKLSGVTANGCSSENGAGGALLFRNVRVEVDGGEMTGCQAYFGGAIATMYSSVSIDGVTVSNGLAVLGGAIADEGSSTYALSSSSLTACSSNGTLPAVVYASGYGFGGCMALNATQTVTVTSVNVTKCVTDYEGGGAWVFTVTQATLTKCSFSDSYATYLGGGISATGGVLLISDSTFARNVMDYVSSAPSGAGLSLSATSAKVERTVFEDNVGIMMGDAATVDGYGGGVYVGQDGESTVTTQEFISCTFSRNLAKGGGGFYQYGGVAKFTDTVFRDNGGGELGGAMLALVTAEVQSCTFERNSVSGSGGAIYSEGTGYLRIMGSTFTANSVHLKDGGALYVIAADSNVTVQGSTFRGNRANSSRGAAIFSGGSLLQVDDSLFEENWSYLKGGAVTVEGSRGAEATTLGRFSNTTFTRNTSPVGGGAFLCSLNCTADLTNCTFSENNSTAAGALLAQETSSLTFRSSSCQGNAADAAGGCLLVTDFATITADGSKFRENRAGSGGGVGKVSGSGRLVMTWCEVEANESPTGGALWVEMEGVVEDTRSSFTGNKASFEGGAVFATHSATVTLLSSQFGSNSALRGGGMVLDTDATLTSTSSSFLNNSASALLIRGSSQATLTTAFFSGNSAPAGTGGAIWAAAETSLTVRSSNLTNNTAVTGGGIFSEGSAQVTLDASRFEGNNAVTGAALAAAGSSKFSAGNLTLVKNSASRAGGAAAFLDQSNGLFKGAWMTGNKAVVGGAGVYVKRAETLGITSSGAAAAGNSTGAPATGSASAAAAAVNDAGSAASGASGANSSSSMGVGKAELAPLVCSNLTFSENEALYPQGVAFYEASFNPAVRIGCDECVREQESQTIGSIPKNFYFTFAGMDEGANGLGTVPSFVALTAVGTPIAGLTVVIVDDYNNTVVQDNSSFVAIAPDRRISGLLRATAVQGLAELPEVSVMVTPDEATPFRLLVTVSSPTNEFPDITHTFTVDFCAAGTFLNTTSEDGTGGDGGGSSTSSTGSGTCDPCPVGSWCEAGQPSTPCDDGSFTFYPYSTSADECVACEDDNLDCTGGELTIATQAWLDPRTYNDTPTTYSCIITNGCVEHLYEYNLTTNTADVEICPTGYDPSSPVLPFSPPLLKCACAVCAPTTTTRSSAIVLRVDSKAFPSFSSFPFTSTCSMCCLCANNYYSFLGDCNYCSDVFKKVHALANNHLCSHSHLCVPPYLCALYVCAFTPHLLPLPCQPTPTTPFPPLPSHTALPAALHPHDWSVGGHVSPCQQPLMCSHLSCIAPPTPPLPLSTQLFPLLFILMIGVWVAMFLLANNYDNIDIFLTEVPPVSMLDTCRLSQLQSSSPSFLLLPLANNYDNIDIFLTEVQYLTVVASINLNAPAAPNGWVGWLIKIYNLSVFDPDVDVVGPNCVLTYRFPQQFVFGILIFLVGLVVYALHWCLFLLREHIKLLKAKRTAENGETSGVGQLSSTAAKQRRQEYYNGLVGGVASWLDVCYMGILARVLPVFQSQMVGDTKVMLFAPEIEWLSSTHMGMLIPSIIILIVYLAGVPLLYAWLLFSAKWNRTLFTAEFDDKYAFLTERFGRKFYWWHLLNMSLRVLYGCILVFLYENPEAQIIILVVLQILRIVVEYRFAPFTSSSVEYLQATLNLGEVFFTLSLLIFNYTSESILSEVIMAISTVLMLLPAIVAISYEVSSKRMEAFNNSVLDEIWEQESGKREDQLRGLDPYQIVQLTQIGGWFRPRALFQFLHHRQGIDLLLRVRDRVQACSLAGLGEVEWIEQLKKPQQYAGLSQILLGNKKGYIPVARLPPQGVYCLLHGVWHADGACTAAQAAAAARRRTNRRTKSRSSRVSFGGGMGEGGPETPGSGLRRMVSWGSNTPGGASMREKPVKSLKIAEKSWPPQLGRKVHWCPASGFDPLAATKRFGSGRMGAGGMAGTPTGGGGGWGGGEEARTPYPVAPETPTGMPETPVTPAAPAAPAPAAAVNGGGDGDSKPKKRLLRQLSDRDDSDTEGAAAGAGAGAGAGGGGAGSRPGTAGTPGAGGGIMRGAISRPGSSGGAAIGGAGGGGMEVVQANLDMAELTFAFQSNLALLVKAEKKRKVQKEALRQIIHSKATYHILSWFTSEESTVDDQRLFAELVKAVRQAAKTRKRSMRWLQGAQCFYPGEGRLTNQLSKMLSEERPLDNNEPNGMRMEP